MCQAYCSQKDIDLNHTDGFITDEPITFVTVSYLIGWILQVSCFYNMVPRLRLWMFLGQTEFIATGRAELLFAACRRKTDAQAELVTHI